MRCTRRTLASVVFLVAAAPVAHAGCPVTLFAPPGTQSFGNAGALTGDLDADGFGDWAVASQNTTAGAGRVYVYRGGSPRNAAPDFTLAAGATGDRFGAAVAAIGDWNRDGFGDLAVGAPFDDTAGTDAGRVYVYFGGPAFNAVADVILNGPVPGARFGSAIGGGADLNQDGGADLVVGAPLASLGGFEGKVFVYFGNVTPSTVPSLTITGAFSEQLGAALALGDLNGDGIADLVAGAPGSAAGARTKLFWGGAAFDALADRTLIVGGVGSGFGEALAVGDVNGDAQPDLVAGAPTFGNGMGVAYVFYGGASSDEFPDLFLAIGLPAGNFGRFVAAGFDLSGDGVGDFAVGVPGREVRIYDGGPAVDNVPEQTWLAEVALDGFGAAGAMGPDTDGNGIAELLVGAPLQNGTGRAYLEPPVRFRITAPAQLIVAAGESENLHLCLHNDEVVAVTYAVHIADDRGWVTPFDATPVISSGDSVCYDLPVAASGDASCPEAGTVTISAAPSICTGPTPVKLVSIVRTVAAPVITACSLSDAFPEPGEQAQLQFCFQNVTQAQRTYIYETSGWAGGCGVESGTVTLSPGGSFCTTRSCQVPPGALCGDLFTIAARVRDECTGNWVNCSKTFSVTATSAVTVACAADTTVDIGQVLHRLLRFTNTSTEALTYNFVASDGLGWGVAQSGAVTLGVGQSHTIDYVVTTPVVCSAQNAAIWLRVASTACPAREFQCVSYVAVPYHLAAVQCPADTTVGDNVAVQRRARWTNDAAFTRTYEYTLSDTRGWSPPVTGTVTLAPAQSASAVITLQVPALCLAGVDSVRFYLRLQGCPPGPATCVSRVNAATVTATVTCPDDFLAPSGVLTTKSFQLQNGSLSAQTFACTIQDSRGWGTPVAQNVTLLAGQATSIAFSLTAPALPLGQLQSSTITFQADDASCHNVFSCTTQATAGSFTAPEFVIEAGANETNFGEPLAETTDLTGDGVADLVAGAQALLPGGMGRLHVQFGGGAFGGSPELTIVGEVSGDGFGAAIAAAGDLNGDGFGDFAAAAPLADAGAADGGRVYVHFGGYQLDAFADRTFTGTTAGAHLGEGLAGVGDVNADGYDDLLIGLPGAFNGLGLLYFGGPAFDTNADRFLLAQSPGEQFGARVARGGDLNGDGYKDFLVAAPGYGAGGRDFGAVYVYFGGPAVDGTPDLVLHGDAGRFGDAITAADFDGDGWPDVIAGAPGRGVGGRVSVFRGGPGVLDATADWVYDSSIAGEQLGASLSAGDIDGDGDADLTVGTQNPDGGAVLRVLVFAGGPSADTVPDAVIAGPPGTRFGAAVAADRDVTGDGHGDVLVGASAYPPHGRVFVYAALSLTPTDVPEMPPVATGVPRTFLGEPREDGAAVHIEYALEHGARDLHLEIFDIAGRRIRDLEQGARPAGRYAVTWDRRDASGTSVRRGVYLVRLRAGEFVAARKAVVARP